MEKHWGQEEMGVDSLFSIKNRLSIYSETIGLWDEVSSVTGETLNSYIVPTVFGRRKTFDGVDILTIDDFVFAPYILVASQESGRKGSKFKLVNWGPIHSVKE